MNPPHKIVETTIEACSSCVYFVMVDQEVRNQRGLRKNGECHRMPPNARGDWGSVNDDEWCGEFKDS